MLRNRKEIIPILLLLILPGVELFGQTLGDYRTNGNVQFNNAANWQVYDGAVWVAAAVDPGLGSGVITIRNGHTATVAASETLDQLIVEAGGTLRVNASRNLTIGNGVELFDLEVYGIIDNYGNINTSANPGAAIRFHDNSLYNHRLNGGTIPEATWLTNSTCEVLSVTNIIPAGLNQIFGNLTWNCSGQTGDIDVNSNLEVRGMFTMASTNTRYLRISTLGSYAINLGGYTQTGGRLNLATGGFTCTFNLSGDFYFSGGNFLTSGSGVGNINFVGPGLQNFIRTGGAFSNTRLNYTVYNGAVLSMGTSIIDVSGTYVAPGTFTLNPGGGLMLGDPYGITLSTTGATGGNIRVLGTRTFSQGADYTYNGSASQVSGDGLPATVRNFTVNNPAGVTMTGNIDITGLLTMTNGNIDPAANSFLLSNSVPASLIYTSGTITGNFERSISQTSQDYLFPVGSLTQTQSLTVNFTDLTIGSLLVSFVSGDPGDNGLPLSDAGDYYITNQYTTGYWTALARNSFASNDYDISLNATGFGPYPVTSGSRIVTRDGTADWEVDGLHGGVVGSTVRRESLTSGFSALPGGTHFGICKTGPFISIQPANSVLCQGSTNLTVFTVNASGYGTLTYQWYKSPLVLLSDDGHFSGTSTSSLGITNGISGDNGEYYCIITDGRGASVQSSQATLTVPSVTFGYNYYTDLTISQANGSEDLPDFPVLVNLTLPQLRTLGNGGHVQNINGYDIIFTDPNNSKLDHQVESYDPVTGTIVAWVRVPQLSATSTTAIKIIYGNQAVTSDLSTEATWISSYKGVWHISNDILTDATSYNNDLTNNGTINIAGLIEEARSFDGTNDNMRALTTTGIGGNAYNQTISVWARYSSLPSSTQNLMVFQRAGTPSAVQLGLREVAGSMRVVVWNWGGTPLVWSNSLPSANAWHYYSYTYDGTDHRLYIDGVEVSSSSTAPTQTALPQYVYLGSYSGGEYFNGIIDEGRYSMSFKSPGWLATEYNSTITPGSFVTSGAEHDLTELVSMGACNDPVTLQGYPAGGTFTGPGISGNTFNPGAAGPGTHTVTYSHNISGCAASISRDILVTSVPLPPVAENKYSCLRNIVDLEATGRNLRWYSDAGLTTLVGWGTPFATGRTTTGTFTYYVTQTLNGCESTATTVRLTIYPNTPVAGSATVDRSPACVGNNATFTLTGNTGYIARWEKKLSAETEWSAIPGTENMNVFTELVAIPGTWNYRAVVTVGRCGTAYAYVDLIVINDVVGPVISGCPMDITVYTGAGNTTCTQTVTWTEPSAVDYCDGNVTFSDRTFAPGSTFPVGTTTVSYTFTDSKNNFTKCEFDVIVIDNTLPLLTCPPNIPDTPANAGQCYATGVALGTPTTADNCGVATVTNNAPVQFPVGVTTVIWTVTDVNGRTATCNQTVTVVDTQNPTITCPVNVTNVPADANQCYATGVALGTPTTADNCGVASVTNNAPVQFPVGVTTVIWTVTDVNGRTATCNQTVTVVDTQNPTITCPVNVTNVPADANQCYATGVALGTPTTADNCGVATVTNNAPAQFPVGTTTVIWTVTDVNGRTATCNQTVTVVDTQNPTITCPVNVTNVPADANQCYATGVALGTPTTADNCGVATVTNNAPAQFPVGTTTVIWTVTDVNGRTATCNQTVTVVDTQNPTITCPVNVTNVPADANQCYATGVALGTPTTADNCGVASVTNNAPVQFPVGVTTVIWTVTDVNGRTATCNQTVTVVDTQNPTITCPVNVTNVPADANQCYATGVALGTPTTADNCGVATVTNNAPAQFPVGTTTVIWTVTDVNGRTATCNQTVTVVDTQNPTITCPVNVTNVPADANQCYATGVALGTPTTADNCGVATVTNNAPAQFPVGTTTVIWTVTDVNGRTATCNQTVTVVDTQNPTITCPVNVTNVPADANQCYATGVALGTPTTADNCGVASVTNNAPVQFPVGVTTVIWTVTDVNGRTATCNQTVTVVDTQNPTITCPVNVTNVPADANQCYATGVALGTPTTADNCGVASVTNNAPVQFPVGTTR